VLPPPPVAEQNAANDDVPPTPPAVGVPAPAVPPSPTVTV
jgi:hypothetical protein